MKTADGTLRSDHLVTRPNAAKQVRNDCLQLGEDRDEASRPTEILLVVRAA
jgi:hypothetical protein